MAKEPYSDEEFSEVTEQAYATIGSGELNSVMTNKIPPKYDGTTSWFAYEQLLDDFLDVTTLPDDKVGPAIKNQLGGEAALHKEFLNRATLKEGPEQAVKHIKEVLRPHFIKGTNHVFLWRYLSLFKMARGGQELQRWMTKWQIAVRRLKKSWNDLYKTPQLTDSVVQAGLQPYNAQRSADDQVVDPNDARFQAYVLRETKLKQLSPTMSNDQQFATKCAFNRCQTARLLTFEEKITVPFQPPMIANMELMNDLM